MRASVECGQQAVSIIKQFPLFCPSVFASPAWVMAAWSHLTDLGSPAVLRLTTFRGERLLPLAVGDGPDGLTVRLAGAPLGDEQDFTGNVPVSARVAHVALRRLLGEFSAATVELEAVAPAGLLGTVVSLGEDEWRIEREPAPVIPVADARVPQSHGARWRRLSSVGRLEFHVEDRLPEAAISALARRRLRHWELRGRLDQLPSVERSATFPLFLGAAIAGMAARGIARMWTLSCDGRPAAEDLHLGPVDRPLLYLRNFAPEFAAYSPGRLLLERTLLELRATHVETLLTGRGDEAYKLAIGAGSEYVINASLRRRDNPLEASDGIGRSGCVDA